VRGLPANADLEKEYAMTTTTLDILVCGGGYVGLSAAVALKLAAPSLDVAVIDAAPPKVWRKDQRASAIAAGAKRLLSQLGVWDEIAAKRSRSMTWSSPIRAARIRSARCFDFWRRNRGRRALCPHGAECCHGRGPSPKRRKKSAFRSTSRQLHRPRNR
jgi:glycine/D-amino acid oxidase-like deaminating enzyme